MKIRTVALIAVLILGTCLSLSCKLLGIGLTPALTVSQGSTDLSSGDTYSFADTKVGATSSQVTFTIKNTGETDLSVPSDTAVTISGTDSSQFSIATAPSVTTLKPGDSATFGLTFSPSAHAAASATATVTTQFKDKDFTATLNLAGDGVISQIKVTDLGESPYTGNTVLVSGTSSVDFGTVYVLNTPNTATHRIQIDNTGDGALVLTGTPKVAITNDTNSNFSVSSSQPSSPIPAGSNTTFDVDFTATQSATTNENATLTIESDSATDMAFTFDLTGTDQYS